MIRALAFTVALCLAVPAFAQTETSPPAPAAEPAQTPAEAAFQVRADAFGGRIGVMAQEMQDAVTAAGADIAKRDADLDAISARYQPEVDGFVTELQTFVDTQTAGLPADQAQTMRAGVAASLPRITGVIAIVRQQIVAASSAPPAT